MENPRIRSRAVVKRIPLALVLLGVVAHAEEWVSVWTPPSPASGGMEDYVDVLSIRVKAGMRQADWRMVSWHRDAPAGTWPPKTAPDNKIIAYVTVSSTFDCANELKRDDKSIFYYSDGTNNAGATPTDNRWGKPFGGTLAIFDFVCGASL